MTRAAPTIGLEIAGAVILAGGRARRMGGGDKGFATLCGRPIFEHVIDRLHAQSIGGPLRDRLAINANGDQSRFAPLGLPVIGDPIPNHPGPLAGILAAILWAGGQRAPMGKHDDRSNDGIYVATVPCDTPFLPTDLLARLKSAVEFTVKASPEGPRPIACAMSHGRRHPVAGLWPLAAEAAIRTTIAEGQRRLGTFLDRHPTVLADYGWPAADPFFNINTADDLAAAARLIKDQRTGRP